MATLTTPNLYYQYGGPDFWTMLRKGTTTKKVVGETNIEGMSFPSYTEEKTLTTSGMVGAVGVSMQIGSQIGEAIGGYINAKASAAALGSQALIAEDNAKVMQFGVEQAFRAGESQLAAIGYKQAETKAAQKVAFAANGISIGVGSSAEQLASTDLQAEVDKITARQNALAQAWSYRRQKMMSIAQAKGARIMANATTKAGRVSMYAGLASAAMGAWAGMAGG